MKIPPEAEIPAHKLTAYLLAPRQADDKSRFLSQAGFSLDNWEMLLEELRRLVAENEAVADRSDEYGTFYRVEGRLSGPNGRKLEVVTIWLCVKLNQGFRFITLKPRHARR